MGHFTVVQDFDFMKAKFDQYVAEVVVICGLIWLTMGPPLWLYFMQHVQSIKHPLDDETESMVRKNNFYIFGSAILMVQFGHFFPKYQKWPGHHAIHGKYKAKSCLLD